MANNKIETVLVLGGNGKSGRRVVEKLRAKGVEVLVTTRELEKASKHSRYFIWENDRNWAEVLQGVDALFIVHPDTSMPEALQQIRLLSEHAYKANIKKVVLLSGRGQDSVVACENVIQHSGLRWTIVRSAWFNQNFTEGHFAHGIKTGEVVFMEGQAGEPFVDLDDLADVVVASLLEPIHDNQVYEVTGDILYTFRDAVAIISKKIGSPITYRELDKQSYLELLLQHGLPPAVAQHLVFAFSEILDGRNQSLGDGIDRVLKRSTKSFASFVDEAF